jgi:hypothetical protein
MRQGTAVDDLAARLVRECAARQLAAIAVKQEALGAS